MKPYALLLMLLVCPMLLLAQTSRTAEVKPYNGKPTLFVDGKPVTPDFYALTHAYFTYVNSGLMMIHTKDGGKRRLYLQNGKEVNVELPPYSTWVLDAQTGQVLLK